MSTRAMVVLSVLRAERAIADDAFEQALRATAGNPGLGSTLRSARIHMVGELDRAIAACESIVAQNTAAARPREGSG